MTGIASSQAQPTAPAAPMDANAERLAQFRERQASSGFVENGDPLAPEAIQSRTAPQPEPAADEPEMPKLRVDPRNAIAARARAARAAANPDGHTAPADRFNIPDGVRVEGDDDEAARLAEEADATRAAPQAERPRAPVPATPSADGRYSLRVNNNNFSVSREELLRYAEVEPDEAGDISDISLVKLAQKHLAASSALESAKAEAKSIRSAQRTQPGHMPGQDEPNADAIDQPAAEGLHSLSDKALIEKVQFGDSDEALEANRLLNQRQFERMSMNDRLAKIDAEIGSTINSFGEKNADIVSDSFLESAHRASLVNIVADEIAANAKGMTTDMVAQLKANPQLAMQAYKAARLDGLNVRTPTELFDAAANTVRTRFGKQPTPQREDQRDNPPPAASRTETKRGLLAQPRPESASIGQQQQPARRQTASEAIRARFGNRMNRG